MEITTEQMQKGIDQAYNAAGCNAYFSNGFVNGAKFVKDLLESEVQKIFDKHKIKLDNLKENRAIENIGDYTDRESRLIDEQIVILASVLGEINKFLKG